MFPSVASIIIDGSRTQGVFNIETDAGILGNMTGESVVVQAGGILQKRSSPGNSATTINADVTVTGNGTLNAGGFAIHALSIANDGGSILASGGTLTVTGNFRQSAGQTKTSGGKIAVGGTFSQIGGQTIIDGGSLRDKGTISVVSGVLMLDHGNVFGSLTVGVDGTLSGSGNIVGDVFDDGRIVVGSSTQAGRLRILGNLNVSDTGTIAMKLGGNRPGQYDRLIITGAAAFTGSLDLSFIHGFQNTIAAGDRFSLITYGSLAGALAPSVTGLPASLSFIYDFGPARVCVTTKAN